MRLFYLFVGFVVVLGLCVFEEAIAVYLSTRKTNPTTKDEKN